MLLELAVQLLGPLLVEFAVRDVVAPSARSLLSGPRRGNGRPAAPALDAEGEATPALLRPVCAVNVVSATPGRLRLEVVGLHGQTALTRAISNDVSRLSGVLEATSNVHTGRLLVRFDPARTTSAAIVAAVDRARAQHLPVAAPPTRCLAAVV